MSQATNLPNETYKDPVDAAWKRYCEAERIREDSWKRLCEAECTTEAAWLIHNGMDTAFPEVMIEALNVLEYYLRACEPETAEDLQRLNDISAERYYYEELSANLVTLCTGDSILD